MTQETERMERLTADNSKLHQSNIDLRRENERLSREAERLEEQHKECAEQLSAAEGKMVDLYAEIEELETSESD